LALHGEPPTVVRVVPRHATLALGLVLVASRASAQEAPPRASDAHYVKRAPTWSLGLTFSGSSGCARYGFGVRDLRLELGALLGYDPFVPFHLFTHPEPNPAPGSDAALARAGLASDHGQLPKRVGHLDVKVVQSGGSTRGTAVWVDENGQPTPALTPEPLTEGGTDRYACVQVLRTLAFVVSLRFPEPERVPLPVCPTAAPVPACPGPDKGSVAPVTEAAPPVRPRNVLFVGTGAHADFGAAWGAIFGVALEAGLRRDEWRWGGWSVLGSFRWDPQQIGMGPPTRQASVDQRTLLMAGRLAGCVHRVWPEISPASLGGCAVVELGEIQEAADTLSHSALHQSALFAGGGIGSQVKVPLPALFYVQFEADVLGIGKVAGGTGAWANVAGQHFAGASGRLGAGLGISF
jgi:hypothetical protein